MSAAIASLAASYGSGSGSESDSDSEGGRCSLPAADALMHLSQSPSAKPALAVAVDAAPEVAVKVSAQPRRGGRVPPSPAPSSGGSEGPTALPGSARAAGQRGQVGSGDTCAAIRVRPGAGGGADRRADSGPPGRAAPAWACAEAGRGCGPGPAVNVCRAPAARRRRSSARRPPQKARVPGRTVAKVK